MSIVRNQTITWKRRVSISKILRRFFLCSFTFFEVFFYKLKPPFNDSLPLKYVFERLEITLKTFNDAFYSYVLFNFFDCYIIYACQGTRNLLSQFTGLFYTDTIKCRLYAVKKLESKSALSLIKCVTVSAKE